MYFKVLGNCKYKSPVHPWNADAPMLARFAGNVMIVRAVQFWNTHCLIAETLFPPSVEGAITSLSTAGLTPVISAAFPFTTYVHV